MAQRRPRSPRRSSAAQARTEPPAPGLLTTLEAAALLKVHPKQVYRLAKHGLPRYRVGFEWRYDRAELLAWSGSAAGGRSGEGARSAPGAAALPAVVASNGDIVVVQLLDLATDDAGPVYGLAVTDRSQALGMLREGRILAAGYHGEAFPARVPEGRMARLHLVRRDVGLCAAGKRAPRFEDVVTRRLATRPASAGVRTILDARLRDLGIDPARVAAGARTYASHRDVAAAVARGEADVGLVTRAWAWTLGLAFLSLASEDFGLLFFAEHLGRAEIVRLCETAQSPTFHIGLTKALGYDARDCGRLLFDATDAPRPSDRAVR